MLKSLCKLGSFKNTNDYFWNFSFTFHSSFQRTNLSFAINRWIPFNTWYANLSSDIRLREWSWTVNTVLNVTIVY